MGIKQYVKQEAHTNKPQHYNENSTEPPNKGRGHLVIHIHYVTMYKHQKHRQKYIQTYFKSGKTLKNILVVPKDRDTNETEKWSYTLA